MGFFTSASVSSGGLQERMTIVDSGDVGIGTINPDSKLYVAEQSNNLFTLHNEMSLNQDISSDLEFKIGAGLNPYHVGAIKAIGQSQNAARLGFFTFASQNENSLAERMTIADNGFVGIDPRNPYLTYMFLVLMKI